MCPLQLDVRVRELPFLSELWFHLLLLVNPQLPTPSVSVRKKADATQFTMETVTEEDLPRATFHCF